MARPIPRSGIGGITWPAVPTGRAALALAVQYQLGQTEWLDGETLAARQFGQLTHLLSHADRTMPFWRDRLRAAGIRPGEALTAEAWARIPVLSRAEAQAAGAALRCLSVPESHGTQYPGATSGSTGMPLNLVKTEAHMAFWRAFLLRDLLWHNIDLTARFAALRRNPWGDAGPDQAVAASRDGPRRYPDLGGDFAPIFVTGPMSIMEIRRSPVEQVAWLLREEPAYLSTFPSNLAALAQRFRDLGVRPRRLRAVRTAGEAVSADLRALVRETMGVPVLDAYSAEEIGYMALQCPDPADPTDPDFHVMAEGVKLEILDDAGQACPPGRVGRVVVTELHNFAMPLIRYELGDYAEFAPPCPCGRGLPGLRAIRGRLRHGLRMPDGTRRAAYFGISFHRVPAIRQFQAAQVAPDMIEIRLVTRRPLTGEEEDQLSTLIRNDLDASFDVRFVYVDEIPRLPSGKFEEFRCELAD